MLAIGFVGNVEKGKTEFLRRPTPGASIPFAHVKKGIHNTISDMNPYSYTNPKNRTVCATTKHRIMPVMVGTKKAIKGHFLL